VLDVGRGETCDAGAANSDGPEAACRSDCSLAVCDPPALRSCLPDCGAALRGQRKQVTLAGSDYSFDCGLTPGLFSWPASADGGKGGYLGADAVLCVAAVASAGTGQYDLLVTADLRIADTTPVRLGQDLRVAGDATLPAAPTWGDGAFALLQGGALSITYMALTALITTEAGALSLSFADCTLPFAEPLVLYTADASFADVTFSNASVVVPAGAAVAVAGARITFAPAVATAFTVEGGARAAGPDGVHARGGRDGRRRRRREQLHGLGLPARPRPGVGQGDRRLPLQRRRHALRRAARWLRPRLWSGLDQHSRAAGLRGRERGQLPLRLRRHALLPREHRDRNAELFCLFTAGHRGAGHDFSKRRGTLRDTRKSGRAQVAGSGGLWC
jgi:hypothetical protein